MRKTYRSLFLTCGLCKLQVDSDARCCKYCGRTIWLKDVSEAPKPPAENVEALVSITEVKVKLEERNNTKAAGVGISTVSNKEQPIFSHLPMQDRSSETLIQKASYTIKDYIQEEINGTMWLVMLTCRGCLGIQCYVSFFLGAPLLAILFGFFALAIAYHRLWITAICWIYCVVMLRTLGAASELGEWYGLTGILLTIAVAYSVFIGIKYREYMASSRYK